MFSKANPLLYSESSRNISIISYILNTRKFTFQSTTLLGFPHSSVDKESTCNAGDPSSIPGSGRSAGEGIGYLLQYSMASLMTQLVKNPLEMWQAWVWSLGWENPLENGKATHSSIWAWRILWGRKELDTTELLSLFFLCYLQRNPLPSAHILLILIF